MNPKVEAQEGVKEVQRRFGLAETKAAPRHQTKAPLSPPKEAPALKRPRTKEERTRVERIMQTCRYGRKGQEWNE